MKRSRTEVRQELEAEAQRAIDELLDWNESTPEPTLTQIEDVILRLRQRLSQHMANVILAEQEAVQPGLGLRCPQCDQEMRFKQKKVNQVESRVGHLKVDRGYYYCPHCRIGVFPPR